jgi:hypothetical protein
MYAETLNADFCRARAEFCYKLAATAHAAKPLFARLYFLAREYEDQAKAADIQSAKAREARIEAEAGPGNTKTTTCSTVNERSGAST